MPCPSPLPGFGFGLAATTLVGQSIGAKRPADGGAAGTIAMQWGLIWMSALGLIFFFVGEPIIRLFSDAPDVVRMGTNTLRTMAFLQPFWAISFIQAGALRGTGNYALPLTCKYHWDVDCCDFRCSVLPTVAPKFEHYLERLNSDCTGNCISTLAEIPPIDCATDPGGTRSHTKKRLLAIRKIDDFLLFCQLT